MRLLPDSRVEFGVDGLGFIFDFDIVARVEGYEAGGEDHGDEGDGYEKIMHWSVLSFLIQFGVA